MMKKKIIGSWFFILTALFIGYFSLKPYLTKDFLINNYDFLKYYVDNYFTLSLTIYLLACFLMAAFLIPFTGLFSMLGGALFGAFKGALFSSLAFSVGSTVTLFIIRHYFQEKIIEKLKKYKKEIDFKSDNWFWIICSLYITTFTPTVVVVSIASISSITLLKYLLATSIGSFPGAFVYSFIGNKLIKFHSTQMPWYTYVIFIILAALMLIPIFMGGNHDKQKNQ